MEQVVDFCNVQFHQISKDKVQCEGAKPSDACRPEKLLQLSPTVCKLMYYVLLPSISSCELELYCDQCSEKFASISSIIVVPDTIFSFCKMTSLSWQLGTDWFL